MRTPRPKTIKFRGAVYRLASPLEQQVREECYDLHGRVSYYLDVAGVVPVTQPIPETYEYPGENQYGAGLRQTFTVNPEGVAASYTTKEDAGLRLFRLLLSNLKSAGLPYAHPYAWWGKRPEKETPSNTTGMLTRYPTVTPLLVRNDHAMVSLSVEMDESVPKIDIFTFYARKKG